MLSRRNIKITNNHDEEVITYMVVAFILRKEYKDWDDEKVMSLSPTSTITLLLILKKSVMNKKTCGFI